MRRFEQLSRKARQRKQRVADNHKRRRHLGKLYVNAGYTPCLSRTEPGGRKHWYYTRTWGPISLNSQLIGSEGNQGS